MGPSSWRPSSRSARRSQFRMVLRARLVLAHQLLGGASRPHLPHELSTLLRWIRTPCRAHLVAPFGPLPPPTVRCPPDRVNLTTSHNARSACRRACKNDENSSAPTAAWVPPTDRARPSPCPPACLTGAGDNRCAGPTAAQTRSPRFRVDVVAELGLHQGWAQDPGHFTPSNRRNLMSRCTYTRLLHHVPGLWVILSE